MYFVLLGLSIQNSGLELGSPCFGKQNAVLFADSFSGVSSTLHSFEQSSIVLYTACRRSLRMIQEIELVSRGYKLFVDLISIFSTRVSLSFPILGFIDRHHFLLSLG
jgi:hypothetical protein